MYRTAVLVTWQIRAMLYFIYYLYLEFLQKVPGHVSE